MEFLLIRYASRPCDPDRAQMREQLVMGYLPVAKNIARHCSHRGENLDDLEQVASLGLVKAIDGFRPEPERPFLTFALLTISREILRHFRDRLRPIRVPRRLKDLHVAVDHSVTAGSPQLGGTPQPSDIAAALAVTVEDILDRLETCPRYHMESLDVLLIPEEGGANRADVISSADPDIAQFISSHALAPHLAALPERELSILTMRFYGDLTQSQIAAEIGISQMHVSRLLAKTLAALRNAVDHDQPPATSPGADNR